MTLHVGRPSETPFVFPQVIKLDSMTLRDYFAGLALNGICVSFDTSERQASGRHVPEFVWAARMAYEFADAMLKAREG